MIAINDNLNSEQLTVPNNIEAIAVSINCKKRLNFGIVYIPPNSPDSYHNSVTSFMHSLPLENNTTIVGDFNDPDINWQVPIQTHPSSAILFLILTLYN